MKRYQEGERLKAIAKKYHVNEINIQKWKAAYAEHGTSGLTTTHGTYSGVFKIYVIEYMYHIGTSLRQTAAHFNIPYMSTVRNWGQICCEKSKEVLYEENRGRRNRMVAKKHEVTP